MPNECNDLIPSICSRGIVPFFVDSSCHGVYFVGITDITVSQGETVDLADGVHAYDGNGNEISFTYTPTEVDTDVPGEYTVTYEATGAGRAVKPTVCGKDVLHLMDCGQSTATERRIITVVQEGSTVCESTVCNAYVVCS